MQTPLDIGVDVASRHVVAACAARSFAPRKLPNELGALRAWLSGVPRASRIGLEATGACHQVLADAAHAAGMTVYVLNPRDVKKYGEGVGRRGKGAERYRGVGNPRAQDGAHGLGYLQT